jgi:cyanophycin synthetase
VELLDSRRLTGPNILSDRPAAVIDVRIDAADAIPFIEAWKKEAGRMLAAVNWHGIELLSQEMDGGISLGFEASVDALYAATEINDWAFEAARLTLAEERESELEPDAGKLREMIAKERNPDLIELMQAAGKNDVPFLSDDDHVSVGYGKNSRTWKVTDVPDPDGVPWDLLGPIPVGMVTGTNGKTTTVRMATAMLAADGLVVGTSSTDRLTVADEVLEEGDYSGPGGARTILRDTRVDVAVLETARGGLLRRGAAVAHADAVVITNIAADHLDDFGVSNVESLADIKWLATRVLGITGRAILNAEDPLLVERSRKLDCMITWFSLDAENEVLTAHRNAGGVVVTVEDGDIIVHDSGTTIRLSSIANIPTAYGGAATHNIANCLAASGLAIALGATPVAIARALEETDSTANPGRCNLFDVGGAKILIDFAHNPHGVSALAGIVEKFGQGRRILVTGQAGDRGDETIRDLARAAWQFKPDRILIKEMSRYARGRERDEVARLIAGTFIAEGANPEIIEHVEYELDAVRQAIEWVRPGDLAIVLVHEDIKRVLEFVGQCGGNV